MANVKEIKNRIEGVQDTKKITNAMYLISSTKLRRAKSSLEATKPFYDGIRREMQWIFEQKESQGNRYVRDTHEIAEEDEIFGILVITADKGLAGAYNQNVIKKVLSVMKEHPKCRLFVVGESGRHYFGQHNIPVEKSFLYTAQNPTFGRAKEIAELLIREYGAGQLDRILVGYTELEGIVESARVDQILPMEGTNPAEAPDFNDLSNHYEFMPNVDEVLEYTLVSYMSGYIYGALVESYCSEQEARMEAMNAANDNAEQLLDSLKVEYNRVRQAAITQEITEVSAGAKAQKKKRMKNKQMKEAHKV